jgi:hypothetical protein
MSLKNMNLGSAQSVVPVTRRHDNYEYGPLRVQRPTIPQEQTAITERQPLKGVSLHVMPDRKEDEERDFQIAARRRQTPQEGSSLDEIATKYGLK